MAAGQAQWAVARAVFGLITGPWRRAVLSMIFYAFGGRHVLPFSRKMPAFYALAPLMVAVMLLCVVPVHAESPATGAEAAVIAPSATLESDAAERMYRLYGAALYQVQVIDRATGKKNAIGSGFQLDDAGLLATNYHVIAESLHRPGTMRLEYIHEDGRRGTLQLRAVDVVNDLAVLQMDRAGPQGLQLGGSTLPKGTRLYALGNPHDIGFTIVEGIHNGLATDSFHDKIHFSGAINQGMSGGPALAADGRVVGINVMTGGNQIGFLVPVEALAALIPQAALRTDDWQTTAVMADIEAQLLASQDRMLQPLLVAETWDSIHFGPVMLPGRLHPALKCWGAPQHQDKDPYRHFWSTCYNEDSLYLGEGFETAVVYYRYDLLTAHEGLWLPRFRTLLESVYADSVSGSMAQERDVTNFVCHDGAMDVDDLRFKSSLCARQYKKFPRLFDLHLYMLQVDGGTTGSVVTLNILGASRENGMAFIARFIDSIRQAAPVVPVPAAAVEDAP